MANHVAGLPNLKTVRIPDFLVGADPWLTARALHTGATVVTHEVFGPAIRRKVSISNIRAHFNVPWMNTFNLLSTLQAEFVLAA